ncbi:hypothetical protein [Arthrobacter sp. Rue61a]|uniref:hypothetical protein n=1 Tax=Arthrobacter sp. Rue61a TaxID=1118963 RepID=UPI00027DF1D3|nr:hypothetical protein [Arthrobacter sp. Rue61a]AFR30507.1 hypothetical protein ARUE_c36280 [Arthrobacter sp. Rue61a]
MTGEHDFDLRGYADWSRWMPFDEAAKEATRSPGVYIAREMVTGQIVYVGRAGERQGKGVRGRLQVYSSGKGAASGLGEASFDRALADSAWLKAQLVQLEAGTVSRTLEWAKAAIDRACLELCWASTTDGKAAQLLEKKIDAALRQTDHTLWNK